MLLIDNGEPQIGEWQEKRRAGANHDPRPAMRDLTPGSAAFGI